MLDVVDAYVKAPDQVGGTEPFIRTPALVGSIWPEVSAPVDTRAYSVPSVIWLSMLQP